MDTPMFKTPGTPTHPTICRERAGAMATVASERLVLLLALASLSLLAPLAAAQTPWQVCGNSSVRNMAILGHCFVILVIE
jgi:hypothetical protein